MDTVPTFIFFKDAEGRFLWVNQALATLQGATSPDEMVGRTDADYFQESDARTTAADEAIILQTGRPLLEKAEHLTNRSGESRWFLTSKMPLRDSSGTIIGTFGLSSDITVQKRSEAERLALQVQLNQAQKLESIGRLAAGIAHEINTPSQFVSDNISYVSRAMGDIERLLAAQGEVIALLEKHPPLAPEIENVLLPTRRIKQAKLRQEVPAALADAFDGMGRITKIVRAMKSFSHPGSNEMALTDRIRRSAPSSSRNEWKYVAELKRPHPICRRFQPAGDFNGRFAGGQRRTRHRRCVLAPARRSDRLTGPRIRSSIGDGTGSPNPRAAPVRSHHQPVGGAPPGLALARSVIVDRHRAPLLRVRNGSRLHLPDSSPRLPPMTSSAVHRILFVDDEPMVLRGPERC
jgi:PAS domain S-box-containing protein